MKHCFVKLGYGLKIVDDKIVQQINDDYLDLEGKDFKLIWTSQDYLDDYSNDIDPQYFLCIKKSIIRINLQDQLLEPIKQRKLTQNKEWNQKLQAWAKENSASKSPIGWWMCIVL
jgi:hypothetical protein